MRTKPGAACRLLGGRLPLPAGIAVALLALLASGCGGPGKQYSLGETEQCLFRQQAVRSYAESDADLVGAAAASGGIGITLADNSVTLGFERNASDAADDLRAAELLGRQQGPKLHADGNVYVDWDKTPTASESKAVEGCLRSGVGTRIANKYSYAFVAQMEAACISGAARSTAPSRLVAGDCVCAVDKTQARYTQAQSTSIPATEVDHLLLSVCPSIVKRSGLGAQANRQPRHIPIPGPESNAVLVALRANPYLGAQLRLDQLTTSDTDPSWALAVFDSGPNTQSAGALLRKIGGRWTIITSGSEFTCNHMPPPQVQAELRLTCQL